MKPQLAMLLLIPFLMGNKGGCASEPPEPTIVVRNVEIAVPNECLTDDPKWKDPPLGSERMTETSRREQQNKRAFNSMRADRAVCRAGVKSSAALPDFRG